MNKPIHIDREQSKLSEAEIFLRDAEKQVADFAQSERQRLNLEKKTNEHWRDENPIEFTASQRATTTLLFEGLTLAHTELQEAAYKGAGYKVEALSMPDTDALQYGREFGNRGQCNPTHYVVGNLVKRLKQLEASGLSKAEIIERYIFVAGGSCGPCRFGSYATEYRKVLRDSGFDGFRVVLLQQPGSDEGSVRQATGEEIGFQINARFFMAMVRSVLVGDIINALGYRIRPYELNKGQTDKVITRARQRLVKAFESNKGLVRALLETRKEFKAIPVDRTQVKPKVAIIGEFWAMTTEGDGNYHMPAFLEKEGAEVDVQLAVAWPLYLLWCARDEIKNRSTLKGTDKTDAEGSIYALGDIHVGKKLAQLWLGEKILVGIFVYYSKLLGLKNYHLPDMNRIAQLSHEFYNTELRGGEGHMEVGKLINNVVDKKTTMTLSIKPFGCMPSSAVSDAVQSKITELQPDAIFLPIETSGDGAVNVYSRVQMQLFKAKQSAQKELDEALKYFGVTVEEFKQKAFKLKRTNNALHKSHHIGTTSAVDLAYDVLGRH